MIRKAAWTRHPSRILADFTADRRLVLLVAMAVVVGVGGTFAAFALVKLIALVTNLVWFGRMDGASTSLAHAARTPWMVAAPVLGGLAIDLLARCGSERIRGHGIPEAIEAILIGGGRMSPKVAVLKPISSAVSIGMGGLIEPRALGVGHDVIGDLLVGHLLVGAVLTIFRVKGVIWLGALSSGTSGGVLAPLLILGGAVEALEAGAHRIYPVVDAADRPVGMVSRGDALRWRAEGGHEGETLGDRVSDAALEVLHPQDLVAHAVDIMVRQDLGRLPVCDPNTGRRRPGFAQGPAPRARRHRQVRGRAARLFPAGEGPGLAEAPSRAIAKRGRELPFCEGPVGEARPPAVEEGGAVIVVVQVVGVFPDVAHQQGDDAGFRQQRVAVMGRHNRDGAFLRHQPDPA